MIKLLDLPTLEDLRRFQILGETSILSLDWEAIDRPWTDRDEKREECQRSCDDSQRFPATYDEIELYDSQPEAKYHDEIPIHREIILGDTDTYSIAKHEYLWQDDEWEILAKYRDHRTPLFVRLREDICQISKCRESYHHPGDHPFWPLREVQEHLHTIRIEDEEVYIDKRNSDISNQK